MPSRLPGLTGHRTRPAITLGNIIDAYRADGSGNQYVWASRPPGGTARSSYVMLLDASAPCGPHGNTKESGLGARRYLVVRPETRDWHRLSGPRSPRSPAGSRT